LVPFFLFVNVEHLTPRVLRDPEARERAALTVLNARDWARLAAVDALLGLVLLLNSPKGATR
jgi:hypothetical protein